MIGSLLNERFRLEEQIGAGGMSTVYRAFDPTLERWVAIKLMHRDMSADADQLERFRREARAVARLSHPHVVTVIDAGEDDGTPFIVLEYVEGETLKERIRRLGRLPVAEAVAYAIEVGRALSAAHAEKLVHRDVKPQNVLIDPEGRAKVTDFGIARSLEAHGLTAPGRVLGTTDYVSPEQALGHDVTEQSDVYSLGIVLYEMLAGQVPFKADTQVAVAMKHVQDRLPDIQKLRPEISSALAAVIERATAKETGNRYATAAEMVHDLEQVLAIEAARAGETSGEATTVLRALPGDTADIAPVRLRRPRRVLILSALAIGLIGGLIAFFATRTERGPGEAADSQPGQPLTRPAHLGRRRGLRPSGRPGGVPERDAVRDRRHRQHGLGHGDLPQRPRGRPEQRRRPQDGGRPLHRGAVAGRRTAAGHHHPGPRLDRRDLRGEGDACPRRSRAGSGSAGAPRWARPSASTSTPPARSFATTWSGSSIRCPRTRRRSTSSSCSADR